MDYEQQKDAAISELCDAVWAFLKFDNEIEYPGPNAPYSARLQWETWKMEHTERMAEAARTLVPTNV